MKEKEIWKDVVGYEGLYKVNQWGDIWSEYTHKKLKWSYHKDGYKIYNLRKDRKAYLMTAHRAVAEAFIPNPDNLPLINHKDENKENCYYKNLEWCTHQYNNTYNGLMQKAMARNIEKFGTEFYLYDMDFNFLGKYKGTKKFAREHKIWSGNFSSALNRNNDGYKHYSCSGFIPSLVPLKINNK